MKYSAFVEVYENLSATTKKLEKTDILSKFLKHLKNHGEWIYLLRGRVLPDYDEREFGLSGQLSIKAISKASGVASGKVVDKFTKVGDLGLVAEQLIDKKRQTTLFSKSLDVRKVFDNLKKLVDISGKGAVDKKLNLVLELLGSATGKEAKYIIRTVLNDLRIGVADALLRDAIAKAYFPGQDMKGAVEEAYDKVNDFAEILDIAIKGRKALEMVEIVPGRPVKVMLPIKITSLDEGFRICGKPLAVEHKYDGFRVLINFDGKEYKLFTRKLDNVTKQFPDVVKTVKNHIDAKSFMLDTEVVGYSVNTGRSLPFEKISQRIRRKYDIDELVKKVPVEINVFDIIYFNGKSVIGIPFSERRKILEKIVKPRKLKIRLSKQFISDDKKEILSFYKDALKAGEEGIMLKKLDALYRPGRRVGYIAKMKPDARDLDLVITGAEYGKGKRAGGLTSFIVACLGDDGKKFLDVGKVSSGLKEKSSEGMTYKEMDKLLQPLIISAKGGEVKVKPRIVVSMTYQNLQVSPRYSSGFALRFPRIKHYRPERGVYDIATLKDIKKELKIMQKRGAKFTGLG